MGITEDVNRVAVTVAEFLNSGLQKHSQSILTNHVLSELFNDVQIQIQSILKSIEVPAELGDIDDAKEVTRGEFKNFNSMLGQLSRDFVLKMGLTKVTDSLVSRLRNEGDNAEETVEFEEFQLSQLQFDVLNQLLLLLDLLIALAGNKSFPSARNDFYHILQLIVESLTSLSTDILEVFWYALESRQSIISGFIFDKKVTLNRIAMLGICNGVTDKYYHRGKGGKYDSYEKDSFNDQLHARVRTFLSSLLLFDDLTGLNKYFAIANRVNREPNLGIAKNGDDELLQDILQFHRFLRDPYSYLKNPRMLSKQVESLDRLYGYLLDEEANHAKNHPVRDIYKVNEAGQEDVEAKLPKQYKNAMFFPEHYWLAPFEEIQRGQKFDTVKAEDQKVALKRFDSSKYRQLLLLQMYLVSCFFVELQSSRKRAVIKLTGAPASTKHVAADSTPELLIKTFLKIKREIPHLIRTWDTQLSFLLQHVSQSEEYWWAWLIYGKNSAGKPLLGDNPITTEEMKETLEKFERVAPYKVKRYFNTHATPQLSRKMKTKTGLSLLEESTDGHENYDAKIDDLNVRIGSEDVGITKSELEEERSVLLWKRAKTLRASEWLKVSEVVDPELLGVDKREKTNSEIDTETHGVAEAEKKNLEMEVANEREEAAESKEELPQKEANTTAINGKVACTEADASEEKTETKETTQSDTPQASGGNEPEPASGLQAQSRKRAISPEEEEATDVPAPKKSKFE